MSYTVISYDHFLIAASQVSIIESRNICLLDLSNIPFLRREGNERTLGCGFDWSKDPPPHKIQECSNKAFISSALLTGTETASAAAAPLFRTYTQHTYTQNTEICFARIKRASRPSDRERSRDKGETACCMGGCPSLERLNRANNWEKRRKRSNSRFPSEKCRCHRLFPFPPSLPPSGPSPVLQFLCFLLL